MKNLLVILLAVLAIAGCGVSFLLLRMSEHEWTAMIVEYLGVKPGEGKDNPAPEPEKPAAVEPEAAEEAVDAAKEPVSESKDEESAKPVDPDAGKSWKGFCDANWYAGRKLSDKDLEGKVVFVCEWGGKESVSTLKRVEEIWSSFKHMPLVVVGSHRGGKNPKIPAAYKKLGLSYSMYESAGFCREAAVSTYPHMYVVNHHGKVVFRGSSDRNATEALVNALTAAKLKQ